MNQVLLLKLLLVLACTAFAGCATKINQSNLKAVAALSPPVAANASSVGAAGEKSNVLTDEKFIGLLDAEITRCELAADKLSGRTRKTGFVSIGVATVGIVAGSIIVPALAAKAAAKSAIAAWGGIAGAANAAQLSLNENGQSNAAAVKNQIEFKNSVTQITQKLKTLQTGQEAAAFIYDLRVACGLGASSVSSSESD